MLFRYINQSGLYQLAAFGQAFEHFLAGGADKEYFLVVCLIVFREFVGSEGFSETGDVMDRGTVVFIESISYLF